MGLVGVRKRRAGTVVETRERRQVVWEWRKAY
jgi:hypothetical protein